MINYCEKNYGLYIYVLINAMLIAKPDAKFGYVNSSVPRE